MVQELLASRRPVPSPVAAVVSILTAAAGIHLVVPPTALHSQTVEVEIRESGDAARGVDVFLFVNGNKRPVAESDAGGIARVDEKALEDGTEVEVYVVETVEDDEVLLVPLGSRIPTDVPVRRLGSFTWNGGGRPSFDLTTEAAGGLRGGDEARGPDGPIADPVARADAECRRRWTESLPIPADLASRCAGTIRDLAVAYHQNVVQPRRMDEPRAWAWAPSEEDLANLTPRELQAMRARSEAQIHLRSERERLEGEILGWIGGTRDAENAEEDALEARAALDRWLAEYRQVLIGELTLDLLAAPPERRMSVITAFSRRHAERWASSPRGVFDDLVADLIEAGTEEGRAQVYAQYERQLRLAQIAREIADEARRRLRPTESTGASTVELSALLRLEALIGKITRHYIERPNTFINESDREVKREADTWLKTLQRDLALQEFMRIAESAVLIDRETGEPITGQQRERIARNAKLQLVEALRERGIERGFLRSLMGWSDSRVSLAAEIERSVRDDDVYRMLDFLDPSMTDAEMPMVFRALANVISREVEEVLEWRATLVPEGGEGGIPGWLYEQFVAKQQVGLGLALDIYSGKLDNVDARIERYSDEAYAVVRVFTRAANTPDPRNLSPADHRLLEAYGFIDVRDDGSEVYRMPSDLAVNQALQTDLDLPGASLLDAISGFNAMKLVLLVAAPELAGAKAVAMLRTLELGEGALLFVYGGTAITTGALADAALEYAETGRVQWDRVAIESLLVGGVAEGVGALLRTATRVAAESPRMVRLLENRAIRESAEQTVAEVLGLSSEAAIEAYWETIARGTDLTYEQFLVTLLQGSIARSAPVAGRAGARTLADITATVRTRWSTGTWEVPPWLARASREDPALATELDRTFDRAKVLAQRFEDAASRLLAVVGDDVTTAELIDPTVVRKVTEALETGRLTWFDVKAVFSETVPHLLEPFMEKINAHRLALFEGIVAEAQTRARRQLVGETMLEVERLRRQHPRGGPEFDAAVAEIQRRFDRELELIDTPPKAPGSKNLTSDIDRSVASPRVRAELRRLTDEVMRERAGLGPLDRPPTSALAYDVNEYIDIFLVINRMRADRAALHSLPVEGTSLTHGQVVEANGISHAMLHMTPAERSRFRESLLAAAESDRAVVEAQLDFAEASLARGERELRRELARLGVDPDAASLDLVIRARDNLYGRRTARLREMEARLEGLEPGTPEYDRLSAEIEREWNFAMREGIETYSDLTGLDVIVNEGQLRGRSVRDLIEDPSFTAEGRGYTPRQLNGLVNNQMGMIVEHVHQFHLGEESAVAAASAIGKYAERAVLGLRLLGVDLTRGPAAALNEISAALVRSRKNPDALLAELERIGDGDADAGLLHVLTLLERTIPGARGLLVDPDPALLATHAGDGTPGQVTPAGTDRSPTPVARAIAILALARERRAEVERTVVDGGVAALLEMVEDELARMRAERDRLRAEREDDARLARLYRRRDWSRVRQLEDQQRAVRQQLRTLPLGGRRGATRVHVTDVLRSLREQDQAITDELSRLRDAFDAAGGPDGAEPTEGDRRRDRRLAVLDEQIEQGEAAREDLAELAAEEATRMAEVTKEAPQDAGPVIDVSESTTPELDRLGAELGKLLDDSGPTSYPGHTPPPGNVAGDPANEAAADPFAPDDGVASRAFFLDGGFDPFGFPDELGGALGPTRVPFPYDARTDWSLVNPIEVGDARAAQGIQSVVGVLEGTDVPGSNGRTDRGDAERRLVPGGTVIPSPGLDPGLRLYVTGLGRLGEDALEIVAVNGDPNRAFVVSGPVVLVPVRVNEAERARIEEARQHPEARRSSTTFSIDAYCLESGADAPPEGTMFRVARPEVQKRYEGASRIPAAADRARRQGRLHPDSDPEEYHHSMIQWAIWVELDGLDRGAFERALVDHTRVLVEEAGGKWTDEIEAVVRGLVPNRWDDVQAIRTEARAGSRQ